MLNIDYYLAQDHIKKRYRFDTSVKSYFNDLNDARYSVYFSVIRNGKRYDTDIIHNKIDKISIYYDNNYLKINNYISIHIYSLKDDYFIIQIDKETQSLDGKFSKRLGEYYLCDQFEDLKNTINLFIDYD